ncbi:MAG TPA: nucleotide exchange factor GrpE [Vicinamibacteria bacterium]
MTEDRDNDGTDRGPGAGEPVPSEPGDPFADYDEVNELEELVPDVPPVPAEPADLDELEVVDEADPTLAPEPLESRTPAAGPPSERGAPSATEEAGELRRQVEAKDAQLAQVMTAYRGLKKETERLRKRIETHQKRRFEQSKNDFIGHFVEVLDNLDRAIDSIENNFDPDSVLEGIILVRSRLVQLLREEGLEKIFVGGQSFDPTHSEAAGIEPVEDPSQDNVVLKELQRGYMLKGALLRPARVIVGRYSHAGGENSTDGGNDKSSPADSSLAPQERDDPDD